MTLSSDTDLVSFPFGVGLVTNGVHVVVHAVGVVAVNVVVVVVAEDGSTVAPRCGQRLSHLEVRRLMTLTLFLEKMQQNPFQTSYQDNLY